MNSPWLTIPNLVSLVRVGLIPLVIIALRDQDHTALAVWGVLVFLSDFLDGWLARRLGQISELGKMLDPVADKLCVIILFPALYWLTDFPLWALVLVFGKDILIALGGWLISRRQKVAITPNFWGKAAVFTEFFAFMVYAFDIGFLKTDSLVAMTVFVTISFLTYFHVFLLVVQRQKTIAEVVAGYSAYGLTRNGRGRDRWVNILIFTLVGFWLLRLIWLLADHFLVS
ncbi:MAG: CDP-alcohol phosphatidyltransferase family protein [Acidobacteria bacterium]|nr:CDP-alcohol phosphatidyltransferase family protein [Acidobacteriota bacterium]